jgi:integrase
VISNQKRTYLTEDEADRLIKAARAEGRQGVRDHALLLVAYRHGLRASEALALQWHQVDWKASLLHIHRAKNGTPAVHPIQGPTLRALRELRREFPDGAYLFQSERGNPLSADMMARIIARAGETAKLGFPVNPHMLRHGCGYRLANRGTDTRTIQAYLGHRNIQNTVRYTNLAPGAFRGLFPD